MIDAPNIGSSTTGGNGTEPSGVVKDRSKRGLTRRVAAVVSGTLAITLIASWAVMSAAEYSAFEAEALRNLQRQADILGANSRAALTFEDARAGTDNLQALSEVEHVRFAELRGVDGSVLARYDGEGNLGGRESAPGVLAEMGADDVMVVRREIQGRGEPIGHIVLGASKSLLFAPFWQHTRDGAIVLGCALLASLFASVAVARTIVRPIRELLAVARLVTRQRDYSVRAAEIGEGELREFLGAFNTMLQEIQSRDAELLRAKKAVETQAEELAHASRLAGMAEVASSILHNVGNVLNGVTVSAAVIAERIVDLDAGVLDRLADRLATDNQVSGVQTATFLRAVADHVREIRASLAAESARLDEKVDHISTIISLQQSHSRVASTIKARASVRDVVESAIQIVRDQLERHAINLKRAYEFTGEIELDRHKTLQILVNLLQNAKDAMGALPPEQRVATLRVFKTDGDDVAISVRDEGMGIVDANLTRLFSLGFTTKLNGHGYGLHASAIAASEMGARLSAESDGPGHGAIFTLRFSGAASPQPSAVDVDS